MRVRVLAPERPLPIAVAWPVMLRVIVSGWDCWSACASVGARERIAIVTNSATKYWCVSGAFMSFPASWHGKRYINVLQLKQ